MPNNDSIMSENIVLSLYISKNVVFSWYMYKNVVFSMSTEQWYYDHMSKTCVFLCF